jgi:hypothetical protein
MKKTAPKTTASVKPVIAAKAAPAKKATKPVAKPAVAKPAVVVAKKAPAKSVKPAVVAPKAAPAIKTTPAVKPAVVAAVAPAVALGTTTIVAAIDVGFGNSLSLRGVGPGLSWEVGIEMENSTSDLWSLVLPETNQPIIFKFLINDVTWSTGEDYTVLPGSSVVLSPTF